MEAPLLQARGGEFKWVGDCSAVNGWRNAWDVYVEESKKMWQIAAPIVFNILCLYGVNSATQIFVGQLGQLELSAVAIGLSVVSNFSFGFHLGMGSALETLCGQAFGAGQVSMLGVYLQRSWIILIASCFFLLPIYLAATPILKLLGQEDDIAKLAGRFSIWIIPQMFSVAINFPTMKFLQAQRKVAVLAWIGLVALVAHLGLLWIFIFVFQWGVVGAAVSYDITMWMISLAQVVYVVGWCTDSWTGFSSSAFSNLWEFTKLSLASAVMLCLEIWYLTILIVLTGHLNNAKIAVGSISICMNINGWESIFFIGVNAAISIRVSNELGIGRPRATKHAVMVVMITSMLIGFACMAAILGLRDYFPIIFTNDVELQRATANVAYILAITMVINSVQPVISGVAIGGGWQVLVAYINLGCYYIFGLPLGFAFGYWLNWGVKGIWVGMLCGTVAQTLALLIVIWKTNWTDEAAQALTRIQKWGGARENHT